MSPRGKKLAIVACGGPAPGINSVIGAATIRAHLSGVDVVGIEDGFKWFADGNYAHVTPLTIERVSRIHFRGGSYIGISRVNPAKTPQHFERTLAGFRHHGIDMLVAIGGDGTAVLANRLAEQAKGWLSVVHVPKTIDNDIDLPHNAVTFGFQTARHIGVEIVKNLMVDAKTTSRWYYVVAQGRKAGHLALAIGKAVGATLTLIPEEFGSARVSLATIVDTLAGGIIKRLAAGRPDGVALLAEGLADCIVPEELATLGDVPRDEHGRIEIARVNLGDMLCAAVTRRVEQLGIKATVLAKSIGYEVRCADPIPMDMEYTRDLGYCAARYIIEGGHSCTIAIIEGRFQPVPFRDLIDPKTGRTRLRMVDVESDRYKIARTYMLTLKREDFDNPEELAKLARVVHMTPDEFHSEFGGLCTLEPSPIAFDVTVGAEAPLT